MNFRINFFLKQFQYYCFILFPIFLITGPFLPDLSVVFISITFVFFSIKEKKYYFYNNIFVKFFIFWCLYLIFSSLLSENILFSLESSLFYFRFGLFSLGVWYIIEENNHALKLFFISLFSVFLFLIFDGYIQYFTDINILGYAYSDFRYGDGKRLTSVFGEKSSLGKFLVFMLPLFFALVLKLYPKNNLIIFFSMSFLILIDVLIFLSGERTALFLLLLATLLIIILCTKLRIIRLLTFIISILVISIIGFKNDIVYERMVVHTIDQLNLNNSDDTGIKAFSSHHESMYITAINMFIDKPIFGVGTKMYRVLCDDERYNYNDISCSTHPHNLYIQLLAETGIVGIIPVIILYFSISFYLFRHLLSIISGKGKLITDYQICLLIALIVTLWPFSPSNNFFNNWHSAMLFLPVGFFLKDYLREKNK